MEDKKQSEQKTESEPTPNAPSPTAQMAETVVPQKTEKERMYDFFKKRSQADSKIILEGRCPKCQKNGRYAVWEIGRGGGKYCTRCDWVD